MAPSITAADVAFSLTTLKTKGHPAYSSVLRELAEVVAEDEQTVDRCGSRRTVGSTCRRWSQSMPIFSEKLLRDAAVRRDLARCPARLGSVQVARFEVKAATSNSSGSRIGGATNLPVARGQYNFDTVRYEYLSRPRCRHSRASSAATICSARNSPRGSGRRAMTSRRCKDGRVKREIIARRTPSGAQGWFSTPGARSSTTAACAKR